MHSHNICFIHVYFIFYLTVVMDHLLSILLWMKQFILLFVRCFEHSTCVFELVFGDWFMS